MEGFDARAFFMWCSVINVGVFALGYLAVACAGDFVYRTHTRWFPMSRETFTQALYAAFGQYKLLILVFNIVPFVALTIMP